MQLFSFQYLVLRREKKSYIFPRQFLLEKGRQLAKLSLRVHSASLLDLAWAMQSCPALRILRLFAFELGASAEGEGEEEGELALAPMPDMAELCLGCARSFVSPREEEEAEEGGNAEEQVKGSLDTKMPVAWLLFAVDAAPAAVLLFPPSSGKLCLLIRK